MRHASLVEHIKAKGNIWRWVPAKMKLSCCGGSINEKFNGGNPLFIQHHAKKCKYNTRGIKNR